MSASTNARPPATSINPVPEHPSGTHLERALDLVFPPVCVGCRRVGRWICPRCWPEALWLECRRCVECDFPSSTSVCLHCATPTATIRSLVAVGEFEGVIREAVHALKFNGHHAISGMMGRLMAGAVAGLEADAVVPIPLHRRRRRERGYDQALLLARSIARATHVTCIDGALCRVRNTQQQSTLDGDARRGNVTGAFEPRATWNGETVLLVDDVSTTGATMEAAAVALREAGAGGVVGLVFAQAM